MKRLHRPSHATVVAYLALFIALGLGTVYAANRINGHSIKPRSTPGNRLKPRSVTGRQIKERSLAGADFLPSGGAAGGACGGTSPSGICAHTALRLHRPSRILAVGNGSWSVTVPTAGPPYDLTCDLQVDGRVLLGPEQTFGVNSAVNSVDAGLPFALAGTSKRKLRAGNHAVQLSCNSDSATVQAPTLTAFAISAR